MQKEISAFPTRKARESNLMYRTGYISRLIIARRWSLTDVLSSASVCSQSHAVISVTTVETSSWGQSSSEARAMRSNRGKIWSIRRGGGLARVNVKFLQIPGEEVSPTKRADGRLERCDASRLVNLNTWG